MMRQNMGGITDWISSGIDTLKEKIVGEYDEVSSAIADLKTKALSFTKAYDLLMADREAASRTPQTAARWQELKDAADAIRAKVSYINSVVDKASNWLARTFGLSGSDALEALPLIPIAYVIGAIAGLVFVTGQIYEFHEKVRLVDQGKLPASALDSGLGKQFKEGTENIMWILVAGAVLFFLWSKRKR